jgi:hypothetical protein
MSHHPIRTRVTLLAILTLCGCSATDETASSPEATTAASEPFSTTPGEPNHEQITATALSFLRPEIVTALQVANAETDVEFVLINANHFDDCNFSGGAQVVSSSQTEAVQALNPATIGPDTELQAIRSFARSLHALQDFYAHTNWVELGGEALVDTSSTAFPTFTPYTAIPSTGFVVVQGPKPKRAALTRDDQAPYPESAIVSVKLSKAPHVPGLISGTVDYESGDFCPRSVAMTHEELNKDKSTNVGREQQFEAAKTLAILQTRHEWCRLVALTRAAWGDAGAAHLATWATEGQSLPDCQTE